MRRALATPPHPPLSAASQRTNGVSKMADLDALLKGYGRFRATAWAGQRQRWAALAEGQSPKVMVIACSDSRVDPSHILDASPGEIFVVRNVANLVPPFETGGDHHAVSAALEFAVTQLEVEEVVVMGHELCGGCAAALTGQFDRARQGEGHFIGRWVRLLAGARDRVREEFGEECGPEALRRMEHEGVRQSLANLRSFPWIAEREQDGRLKLRGAFFSITDGTLHLLDEESGRFTPAG